MTGTPVARATERIEFLITRLSEDRERIIIPTPVLSEILVYAGNAAERYIDTLNRQAVFRIAPFDQKAAIEAAIATRDALARGGHRVDVVDPQTTKAKIKFDRQIVAIARAEGAHSLYSDDEELHRLAKRADIKAFRTSDLELPPEDPQQALPFGEA
ncbi:MAG: hypothetical protein AAFY02_09530 [Pseudomonadota bacterium]